MTAKTKVSLRPLGVIAAGDSEEAAVRNFLRLKAKTTAIAEAAMYGIDLTGGKVGHFLVSTASIAAPFSPLSGQMSATKYKIGEGEAAASVLSQFGTQDRDALMAAFASAETAPAVFVATCSTCQHVSASDSKALLKHCTLCGDELPQEDEGDSEIDLTIADPEVEDDAAGDDDTAAAGSEVDGDGTDPDLGAGADDENLGGETPEEVPQVSEDDTPTEADEGDAEAAVQEVAEGIQAALSASWVAHSKNFFAEDNNELKASFYDALSSAGVMNAAEVVESAFASAGEDFGRSLIARAFSLLEMPVEARNQLVSAITKANVAVPGDNGVSVASHVSERLGEMGTVVSSVQAGGDLGAAQQIRNTVQSLHRRR